MLLVTDLAASTTTSAPSLLIANASCARDGAAELDAAYADAVARLDAMQAALATPRRRVDRRDGRPIRRAERRDVAHARGQYQPAVERVREAHPGRRGVPDPARPAVRGRDRGRPARRLPGAAHAQPVAVHVLPALRPGELRHRRLRRPRRWSRCTDGERGAAPDRRHPPARRDRRRRTPRWPPSWSATRRSGPST